MPDRSDAWSDRVRFASAGGAGMLWLRCADWPRRVGFVTLAAVAAFATGAFGAFFVDRFLEAQRAALPREAIKLVVERIIQAESRGDPNAKNPRSSATGAGQFIDATWLELIRKHRADLSSRNQAEILDLRRDPHLAREITMRFVEQNAAILRARGVPVTPGTLYLSHFAGGAGAAAILQATEDADAALVMARADSTGRTSREQLVKANPFLEGMNAAGLKKWADRKMRTTGRM